MAIGYVTHQRQGSELCQVVCELDLISEDRVVDGRRPISSAIQARSTVAIRLAAEGVVGAGPDGQRVHPGVAAAAAGDGGGVAAGLPPPARPLVAPHQVGGR